MDDSNGRSIEDFHESGATIDRLGSLVDLEWGENCEYQQWTGGDQAAATATWSWVGFCFVTAEGIGGFDCAVRERIGWGANSWSW